MLGVVDITRYRIKQNIINQKRKQTQMTLI